MITSSQPFGRQRANSTSADIVPLTLGLVAVLLIVKIVLLPFPVSTLAELVRWLLRLAVVWAPDACFAASLAAVCWLTIAGLSRWPRSGWLCRSLIFAVYYLAGLYAVASIPMYQAMKLPLTLPLLSYAGGPFLMGSSIRELLPPGIWALLLLAPVSLLAVPRAMRRWSWISTTLPLTFRSALLGVCLLSLYGTVCHAYVHQVWTDPNRWERRIAQSPHAVLLGSCLRECLKDRPLTLSTVFPDADESDFIRRPAVAVAASPSPSGQPTNVILIVLESTGVEYLGLYGSKHPTTPNLDRLAAEQGLVLDNVYVQTPNSCKSLVALTAAVYPRADWRLIVRDCPEFAVPTMAEVLVDRGYRTCFLHSGYWGWKNRDRYLSARGAQTLIDAERLAAAQVNSWGVSDRAMYQAALDWIDQRPGQPFFAFAYTIETHHPYVAAARKHDFGVHDEELNRYLNAVRAADEHIGWLMEQLRQRGLADSTLVAVTSDHGESFGQHGQRVHSFGVYEPDVHVPLVLLHPAFKDRPRRLSELGQHIDIPPTLLGLIGVDSPPVWQGRDLLNSPPAERIYFFSTGNEVVLGVREAEHKYHYYIDSGREELFDLASDAGELHNLAVQQPARCAAFRRRVGGLVQYQRRFLSQHGAP